MVIANTQVIGQHNAKRSVAVALRNRWRRRQVPEDLRDEIQTMITQGNSDEDIKRFLVDRYGDFVLYRPPVRGNTLLLWLAPLLLLTTGAAVMAVTIHRRRVMLAEEALAEARGGRMADPEDGSGRPDP